MISVEHLTKYYGDHLAVDDISFELPEGHIYGFLGPNGAGKSTTMNIMTGCLSATKGKILIGGHDIFEEPLEAKRLIGYLPEQPPLYLNENPVDYLEFVGRAKGLKGSELAEQVEKVIRQTGIERVRARRISTLSKGYKQRVGIAQALLGDPEIIILDEPTVGLDPLQIIEIRDLIRSLGEDHTIIFSSHILSEVQAICDEILMIAKGKLVAFDTPENLENNLLRANEIQVTTDAAADLVKAVLVPMESVKEVRTLDSADGYTRVSIQTDLRDIYELSRQVFHEFASGNMTILEMNLKRAGLEDIFIELAEGQTATAVAEAGADMPAEAEEGEEPFDPETYDWEGKEGGNEE